jgi:anti-anti-sigma factor
MELRAELSEHQGVPVLTLDGELDTATVPRLHDRFVQLAREHPGRTAIVDLDGVASIDDTGLGTLLGGLRRMTASSGDLVLVCSTHALLDELRRCRLDRVFVVHPTRTAAISSLLRD